MALIQSLTEQEAFLAMYAFLDARSRSETLGTLLRAVALTEEGKPADPAVALDWQNACRAARTGQIDGSKTRG